LAVDTNIIVQGQLSRTVRRIDYGYAGNYATPVTSFVWTAEVRAYLSNNPAIFDVTRSTNLLFRPTVTQATNAVKVAICQYATSQGYNTNTLKFTFKRVSVP
jgi:hypothetical protein